MDIRAYRYFFRNPGLSEFNNLFKDYRDLINSKFDPEKNGHIGTWNQLIENFPEVAADSFKISNGVLSIGRGDDLNQQSLERFKEQLKGFHPWRKGPFNLFGVGIDTEWRSDYKWDRVVPYLSPLEGRKILDVGCGSGYHCWRMLEQGAKAVIGIDPGILYVYQFLLIKHFLPDNLPITVLPMSLEEFPENSQTFDTVFSMGVFYHRQNPFAHLNDLRKALKSGGELVLETLIIDGGEGQVLVPDDRYAKMRNVWFLPTVETMMQWLGRAGFTEIRCVDENTTSFEEQRRTEWMHFESLQNFLDSENPKLTIEGHPRPKRGVFVCKKL